MRFSRFVILPMVIHSFLICSSLAARKERLVLDFVDLYSMTKVAIVTNAGELEQPMRNLSVAYISYANVDLQDVVGYINDIKDGLDIIFFFGSDHSQLVPMLDDSTDIFHSHILSIMENQVNMDLNLRLDTNIIFYTPKTQLIFYLRNTLSKGDL